MLIYNNLKNGTLLNEEFYTRRRAHHKPIHKDIVGLVNGAGKTFNHVVDSQASIANNLIHTGRSTLSSLSLTLAIGGVAVLAFMLMKK